MREVRFFFATPSVYKFRQENSQISSINFANSHSLKIGCFDLKMCCCPFLPETWLLRLEIWLLRFHCLSFKVDDFSYKFCYFCLAILAWNFAFCLNLSLELPFCFTFPNFFLTSNQESLSTAWAFITHENQVGRGLHRAWFHSYSLHNPDPRQYLHKCPQEIIFAQWIMVTRLLAAY